MIIEIVTFDNSFLELSWNWLNDKDIKALTNTPNFDKQKQREWFENLNSKKDYLLWGVEIQKIKIGVCGLKNIRKHDCEYWGYIGNKSFWGKGFGTQMVQLMEKKAKDLGIKRIWLKVLVTNIRAKNLYLKNGYNIEYIQANIIIMEKCI